MKCIWLEAISSYLIKTLGRVIVVYTLEYSPDIHICPGIPEICGKRQEEEKVIHKYGQRFQLQ